MDTAWFKKRQREVGVTADVIADRMGRARSNVSHILNGHQRMSLDWAQAFAEALQVPLATILEKAGVANGETTAQLVPGFAESDVTFFSDREPMQVQVKSYAQAFGGNRPGVDVWRVKGMALALAGYLPGDWMLVDTHQSERTRAGDVVIAQIYNNVEGNASTVLRRFEPPVLVAASADPTEQRVHVVDGKNVVIRGKVIASWRV